MGILDGVRVLDMTSYIQGPAATLELADMGADVVKVEAIDGDPLRSFGKKTDGLSPSFEALNRNKRCIALDLKKPAAVEVVQRLARQADVLVVNFRQKLLVRLGIDYPSLVDSCPRLIHVTATAYGVDGPDVDGPAFDIVAGGRSGLLIATGRAEGEPRRPLSPSGDLIAAKDTVNAIALALFERERSGRGQRVVTSLLRSQIAFQRIGFGAYLNGGELVNVGHRDGMALSTWYRTRDEKWIVISLLHPRFFPILCEAIGRPDLAEDPRFGDPTQWAGSDQELRDALSQEFQKRDRDEWVKLLRESDLPGGPVLDLPEVVEDEQVKAQDLFVQYSHPIRGQQKEIGFSAYFERTPATVRLAAPLLGEHTLEILTEAGYGSAEQQEMIEQRAASEA
ncbi:CoA transferase [Myxococcota bacterium]|nr:CoA transferase [Myxococcota bacterium]